MDSEQCKVCSAVTNKHVYYGAVVCTSCRAFFRRNVVKSARSSRVCLRDRTSCGLVATQSKCPKCRLEKCYAVGMKESLIRGPNLMLQQTRKNRRRQTAATPAHEGRPPVPPQQIGDLLGLVPDRTLYQALVVAKYMEADQFAFTQQEHDIIMAVENEKAAQIEVVSVTIKDAEVFGSGNGNYNERNGNGHYNGERNGNGNGNYNGRNGNGHHHGGRNGSGLYNNGYGDVDTNRVYRHLDRALQSASVSVIDVALGGISFEPDLADALKSMHADNVRVLLIARLLYGDGGQDRATPGANDRQLRSACTESKLCPEQLFKCSFISERFKWLLKQLGLAVSSPRQLFLAISCEVFSAAPEDGMTEEETDIVASMKSYFFARSAHTADILRELQSG